MIYGYFDFGTELLTSCFHPNHFLNAILIYLWLVGTLSNVVIFYHSESLTIRTIEIMSRYRVK